MKLVDIENRWVYKGSVTTPPCDKYVYWNIASTIYPI
jgi:carbonic anhydrase